MTVYRSCPTFYTPFFTLRLVRREDAPGLLKVYSDRQAQYYFNADNCTSDFRFSTLQEMEDCIGMWLDAYDRGEFVRWTVLDEKRPVGTVEMCLMNPDNGGTGVLRIDLMSRYEFANIHDELLRSLLPELHELFGCLRILTKSLPAMLQRRLALVLHGFIPAKDVITGAGGIEYGNYWVHRYDPEDLRISCPKGGDGHAAKA